MSYKTQQRKKLQGFPLTARDKRQAKGSRKARKQERHKEHRS